MVKVTRRFTTEERFILQTAPCPVTGCWLWCGAVNSNGYGAFRSNGKNIGAHKYSYESKHGPVPNGLVLDHFVCDQPLCVNPDHLRPTTSRENTLRGGTVASANLAKQTCPKCGGKWSARSNGTGRYCGPCKVAANAKRLVG